MGTSYRLYLVNLKKFLVRVNEILLNEEGAEIEYESIDMPIPVFPDFDSFLAFFKRQTIGSWAFLNDKKGLYRLAGRKDLHFDIVHDILVSTYFSELAMRAWLAAEKIDEFPVVDKKGADIILLEMQKVLLRVRAMDFSVMDSQTRYNHELLVGYLEDILSNAAMGMKQGYTDGLIIYLADG